MLRNASMERRAGFGEPARAEGAARRSRKRSIIRDTRIIPGSHRTMAEAIGGCGVLGSSSGQHGNWPHRLNVATSLGSTRHGLSNMTNAERRQAGDEGDTDRHRQFVIHIPTKSLGAL